MKTVLSVAGSDCSGGAGIQADLKTIGAFGLYGMSAVTAITVQNTCGVYRAEPVSAGLVEEQMRAVFEDIRPDAVKIGMVADGGNVRAIVSVLQEFPTKAVLDPVMVSTSGRELLDQEAVAVLTEQLFPLVTVITPNLPEAERLFGSSISCEVEREQAAECLAGRYGCSVLIKGGHAAAGADDLLYHLESGRKIWYRGERTVSANTHGTGCTLSTAVACGLAQGKTLEDSVRQAKLYVAGAIREGLDLGRGNGPLDHFYQRRVEEY